MLTIFLRAVILFLSTVVLMRLMGKRQIAQLQPYELVLSILIADLAATPMSDIGTPLLYGLVPMLALLLMHTAITLVCMKSQTLRRVIDGKPFLVVQDGKLKTALLDKLGYSLSDLLEELRAAGFPNIGEVGSAVLETSGKLSAFPDAKHQPVTVSDMNLPLKSAGLPVTLVLDGKVQTRSLKAVGADEPWLRARLNALGFRGVGEVLLLALEADGELLAYRRADSACPQHVPSELNPAAAASGEGCNAP